MRQFMFWAICGCALVAAPRAARADFFVLSTGGRIEGTLLNPDQSPRESYVVELAAGGKVAFNKYQVARVIVKSPSEANYDQWLLKMPDTVDGHWRMAEWCLKYNLTALREFHLQTIVDREPDHSAARLGLGFTKIDGKWVMPDEHLKSQGYVKHTGAWRTPQEIALLETRGVSQDAERKWRNNINTWRNWLNRSSRAADGAAALMAIKDPLASPALVELLEDEKEPLQYKLMYVETLGRMVNDSPKARGALVNQALYSNDANLRDKCLDNLEKADKHAVARMFAKALGDKNNKVVNRAGVGLARMNDPSTIPDLIDALTTSHKFIVIMGGGPGGIGAGFGGPGGGLGGLAAGGGAKQIEQNLRNENVLNALIVLTGGNHCDYDKERWKQWYAETQVPKEFDLRRTR
jgi:hypothetical protein